MVISFSINCSLSLSLYYSNKSPVCFLKPSSINHTFIFLLNIIFLEREREMGRTPCCDKSNVKKGPWSPEEDSRLKQYIEKHGTGGNWISLPQKAGLKRCGKSCRLRWLNYLRPDIKHGDFSVEEDLIIYNLFATIGSRWSVIAAQLPGRTDNDIKNYWNTKLKKKLMSTISSSHKNNPHDPASLSSFLQPSSTNSSSSSSPSSYSDSNQTNYPPLNPTWSSFSSTFEPISFSTNLLNAGGGSFPTNAGAPIHHLAQESFVSPMIHQNYHVNDGLLVIRGEASCSSSDGSCRDGGGGEREEIGGKREYLYDDGVEEKKKKMVFRDCCSGNGWNNEKGDGIWTETPLEYGFEEIKKLISTSSCSDIYFDEN